MRKLSLKLESLEVETFETAEPAGARGTVGGFGSHEGGTTLPHTTTGNQIECHCSYDAPTCCYTCGYDCNSGGDSCGCGGTDPNTNEETCATGGQIICGCHG
jgi:hypothetical protein